MTLLSYVSHVTRKCDAICVVDQKQARHIRDLMVAAGDRRREFGQKMTNCIRDLQSRDQLNSGFHISVGFPGVPAKPMYFRHAIWLCKMLMTPDSLQWVRALKSVSDFAGVPQ